MRTPRWLEALLALPVAGAALWTLLLLLETIRGRYDYPYDLEWMEGGMLVHVLRLQEGAGIYVEPSADFIPYIYPPLYAWLLSALGEPSYATARLLTAAGTLAAAAAAAVAVRREGGWWGAALGAAGIFLACYDESGAFFDLARTDGLALGLMAWALVSCRSGSAPGVVLGGLTLAAAFAAKHNYALFGVPIVLWLWRYRGWRRAGLFALASAGPALIFTGAVQWASGGWFLTYLLEVPSAHPLVGERAWPLTPKELWAIAPWVLGPGALASLIALRERRVRYVLLLVGAGLIAAGAWGLSLGAAADLLRVAHGALAGSLPASATPADLQGWAVGIVAALTLPPLLLTFYGRGRGEGARYWAAMVMLGAPLCALMRAHHGGFINVQIPGYWLVSVAAGLMIAAALRRAPNPVLFALAAAALCWQMKEGRWDPEKYLPTDADRAAGEAVVEAIAAVDGEVFAPHFPWYPYLAGKRPSLPLIALWDIDHKGGPLVEEARVIDRALKAQRWAGLLMPSKPIKHGIKLHYKPAEKISIPRGDFETKTGWRVKPQRIWRPMERVEGAEGADAEGSPAEDADVEAAPSE